MCILCNILLTCCNKIHLEIQSWFVVMCVRRFFLHTFHFICHLVFVESIHHPLGGLHSGSLVSSFQYTESSEVFLISSFVASPYSAFFIPCLCFASTFLFPFYTILTTKLALSQVSWWNHNWQCWCLTSSPSRKRSHGSATNSSIAAMRPRKGGKPSMASGHLVQRDKHVPQLKWNPPFTYLL